MSHPDNTFKTLKGEETFVERWLCKFGWHRWTKWSEVKISPGGMFTTQTRRCVDCGIASKRNA